MINLNAFILPLLSLVVLNYLNISNCYIDNYPYFDHKCLMDQFRKDSPLNQIFRFNIGKFESENKIKKLKDWWYTNKTNSNNVNNKKIFVIGTYKTGKTAITNWLCNGNTKGGDLVTNTRGLSIYDCGKFNIIDCEGFYQPLEDMRSDLIRAILTSIVVENAQAVIVVSDKLFYHEIELFNFFSYNMPKHVPIIIMHNRRDIFSLDKLNEYKSNVISVLGIKKQNDFDITRVEDKVISHFFIRNGLYNDDNNLVRHRVLDLFGGVGIYESDFVGYISMAVLQTLKVNVLSPNDLNIHWVCGEICKAESDPFELTVSEDTWVPVQFSYRMRLSTQLKNTTYPEKSTVFAIISSPGLRISEVNFNKYNKKMIIVTGKVSTPDSVQDITKQIMSPYDLSFNHNDIMSMKNQVLQSNLNNGLHVIELIRNDLKID